MKITTLKLTIASVALLTLSGAHAESFVVDARSGPWMFVNGGLNSAFQYDSVGPLAPTIISVIGGINISAGQSITLSYQSGTIGIGGVSGLDANGDPSLPNPQPNGNGAFPNLYMASVPAVNAYSLVGTFVNNTGEIVGTPFGVG